MSNVKLGFLSFGAEDFDYKWAECVFKKTKAELSRNGIEAINADGLIMNKDGLGKVIRKFKEEEIDCLLIQIGNFPSGELFASLVEVFELPIILWALPEPVIGQALKSNSLCGTNMASSLLYRLKRYYKYLYAPFNDKVVLKTIAEFLRPVETIKRLRKTKIGLVGYHVPGFYNLSFDELRLRNEIGPQIHHIDLGEVRDAMNEISDKDSNRIMDEVNDKVALNKMGKDIFERYAKSYGAFRLIAKRYDCNSLAIKCWPDVDKYFGISVCAIMAKLTDDGILAGCEGDVYGTVTMLMQNYITDKPPFIVDLVHIIKEKNIGILWHCGNAPFSLAGNKDEVSIVKIPNLLGEGWGCNFGCKSGGVTFAKLSEGEGYRMLITSGNAINDKAVFCGTSAKVKFVSDVGRLMDTIIYQGFEHHFSIIYQDVVQELEDICGMLRIKAVKV